MEPVTETHSFYYWQLLPPVWGQLFIITVFCKCCSRCRFRPTNSVPAIWLHHHPLRGVDSVRVDNVVHGLLLNTITRRWLGENPFVQVSMTGPRTVWKRFIGDHVWWGRLKPGCQIVGSITIVWLSTEADDQSSLHCVTVSTDVMSDHVGCRDASRGGGCSKTSAYTGQFWWASVIWSIPSVATLRHTLRSISTWRRLTHGILLNLKVKRSKVMRSCNFHRLTANVPLTSGDNKWWQWMWTIAAYRQIHSTCKLEAVTKKQVSYRNQQQSQEYSVKISETEVKASSVTLMTLSEPPNSIPRAVTSVPNGLSCVMIVFSRSNVSKFHTCHYTGKWTNHTIHLPAHR